MGLNNLKPAAGSTKSRKRIGRGEGSGHGGTSTRGHKGAKSRSGYKKKVGFEGGQMPLQRRVPKFGFKNPFRVEYHGINLDTLQKLADEKKLTEVTPEVLTAARPWWSCAAQPLPAPVAVVGRVMVFVCVVSIRKAGREGKAKSGDRGGCLCLCMGCVCEHQETKG